MSDDNAIIKKHLKFVPSSGLYACTLRDNYSSASTKALSHVRSVDLKRTDINLIFCKLTTIGHPKKGHYHCLISSCKRKHFDKLSRATGHACAGACSSSVSSSSVVRDSGCKRSSTGIILDNVTCPYCNLVVKYKKNLKAHITKKHEKRPEITHEKYLDGICINKDTGEYFVNETFRGYAQPVHVKKLTTTTGKQEIDCDSNICRDHRKTASRSKLPSFECDHVESIT